MSKKEQFDLYLSDNWGCDSVSDFAMKVVDALDDGKIEDIIEVTEFIKTNYGSGCCSAFLYHFKGILIRRNTRKSIAFKNRLIDDEVDNKCRERKLVESVFDEYFGDFLDGYCEDDFPGRSDIFR